MLALMLMQAMEQAMVSADADIGAGNGKGVGAGVGADVDAGVDAGEGTFIYHVHVGTPRLGSPCSPRRASNTRTFEVQDARRTRASCGKSEVSHHGPAMLTTRNREKLYIERGSVLSTGTPINPPSTILACTR